MLKIYPLPPWQSHAPRKETGKYLAKPGRNKNKAIESTVPGQLTPNHLTPESTHPIFGQLTLYMK